MDFELNEDEEMLKALTERFVADRYDHDSRRAFLGEPAGFSAQNWAMLGELGLIAALLPPEMDGLGVDGTGIATIFEALGRGLVVEPLAEAVVLAGRLFAATAPAPLRETWRAGIAAGTLRLALADREAAARGAGPWIATTAAACGDDVLLTGEKAYCVAGGGADAYLVSARSAGAADDASGIDLYLVPADAPRLARRDWRMADGSVPATLMLDSVAVPAANRLGGGSAAIASAQVTASLARTAEALGVMERMFADTLDYLRTREQFGTRLGTFQAIQHRMVAQYVVVEQCRALLELAMVAWDTPGFARAVHGARAFLAQAALPFGHEMIQFHGGMGVTDELAIGAGHKRLLVLSRWPDAP